MGKITQLAERRSIGWPSFHMRSSRRTTLAPHRPEWWLWVCPECGHYETEGGDYFTTGDGRCPVWKIGGRVAHEVGLDFAAPRLVRVRVRA